MTFVSYAQNLEDVMLDRALKNIEVGFYIDVGACDADIDSVTKAFYDRGWSGINIEAVPELAEKLTLARPRDITLSCAAGVGGGSVTLFEPDVRGWATTSEGQGLQLIDSHVTCVERTVPVRTLTEICDEYAGGRDIHFLKIDVEGAESDVIAGMDFTRYRPWILVIESCAPRTEVDSFDSWEPQIVTKGYRHVYRDGLNRYYVAGEREELFEAFDLPPNLFDGYIFSREVETRQQLEDTRRHLVHQEQSLEDTIGELRRLRLTCADGERALARERGQTSRLDADLARARARIARLKAGSIKVIARRSVVRARVAAVSAAAASARTASRVDGRLRADISRGARQAHRLVRATKVNAKRTAVRLDRMARRTKAGFEGMARRAAARTRHVTEQTAATTRRVATPLGVVGRKGIKKSARSARAAAKFSVLVTNAALNQVPGCKRFAVRALRVAPPVERRLREVVRRRFLQEQYKRIANTQVSHPEPSRPLKRARPASLGRKRIEAKLSVGTVYYYVGHTVKFSANTGVQRVVRKVAAALHAAGVDLVFVKWDDAVGDFVLVNKLEIGHLAAFGGPADFMDDPAFENYPSGDSLVRLSETTSGPLPGWLFVPEVTYINFEGRDLTGEIIAKAGEHALKTAFVFYDAIPLRREELADYRDVHLGYMEALTAADAILPISDWSKVDYEKYASSHAEGSQQTVKTLHLSGEMDVAASSGNDNTDDKLVLSVGSITEHKNQLRLIEAFESYCRENPECDWSLVLAGHVHPSIEPAVRAASRRNCRVSVVLGPSDEEVHNLYRRAAFTVFPSIEEGFGLPIAESYWFGKPCVCADFGSMGEVGRKHDAVMVDTRSAEDIGSAIARLMSDDAYRASLTEAARRSPVASWDDYADDLVETFKKCRKKTGGAEPKPKKRIFWLGMHKILVKTELPRLRQLGYEVYNPPYLSDVVDQSAELDWDFDQPSTLPESVFERLSETKFFYVDSLDEETVDILNEYFDAVVVTISPTWLAPLAKAFRGTVIYRVYGQAHSIAAELERLDLERHVGTGRAFHFLPHAAEAVDAEPGWFRHREAVVPYCLTDDVFGYADSWSGLGDGSGTVAVTCPNIANPFFAEHYAYLKQNFNSDEYRIYGVQTSDIDDPAVVGTLPRHEQLQALRNSLCYVYTFEDPRVCYLPPIESMVMGVPVLFRAGSLLDKYFECVPTPARFENPGKAASIVARLREGDEDLARAIVKYQGEVRKRYQPAYVWDQFDRVHRDILG